MGFAEGGIAYRTYFVDGELPSDLRSDFLERIRARRFRPLEVEAEEDVSLGWVPFNDALGTAFRAPEVFIDHYLVLTLRFDRWAIPPVLLKAAVRQAEAALKHDQNRDHLTRTERSEIVERERARLKRQTLPAVRAIDVAWNLDTAELRFGSVSRNVNELFSDLFELTFGLRLIPDSPYIRALHCGLPDELVGYLADVEPTPITTATESSTP